MSGAQLSNDTATDPAGAGAVPMRPEVVVVPVAHVERAKSFYRLKASKAGHKPPG